MAFGLPDGDERGSSPVEFVLVGALLTAIVVSVIQLGLVVYVRNVVHDAAVEGAHYAALADTGVAEGAEQTRRMIAQSVGDSYASDITVGVEQRDDYTGIVVLVRTTMPVIGLLGVPGGMEVRADAPVEALGGG